MLFNIISGYFYIYIAGEENFYFSSCWLNIIIQSINNTESIRLKGRHGLVWFDKIKGETFKNFKKKFQKNFQKIHI